MEELNDQQHEDIAAYLTNRMPPDQRPVFEAEVLQNKALQDELALQRRIRRGVHLANNRRDVADMYARVKQELDNEEAEAKTGVVKRPNWYVPMAWVAAALIFIVAGLFLRPAIDRLFNLSGSEIGQHHRPPHRTGQDTLSSDTSSSVSPTDTIHMPITDPSNLDMDRQLADTYFKAIPKSSPPPIVLPNEEVDAGALTDSEAVGRDSIAVLQAISLLQKQRTTRAIPVLQQTVLEGYPGHWRNTAEWYLALGYLRNHQRPQALAVLDRVAHIEGHPYQVEAKKLVKALKR
ncbi:hypothetical protein [Spirosoma linguale]|uniref:Tetratricopeptide repeat protein n=1 Tax=Spirosoma linguale (strain ATCC 33905 / DSM 74 / LMG 10896 / Claus 1) TaxID=504472 RepID=D2QUG1_SPILD|nr:hypothetical protein Slin_6486 [Spirosoma linguale DSM 74]